MIVNVNTISRNYTAEIKNYKLDFGVQYTHAITKKDELTLGLTYSLGHKLNSNAECNLISEKPQIVFQQAHKQVNLIQPVI